MTINGSSLLQVVLHTFTIYRDMACRLVLELYIWLIIMYIPDCVEFRTVACNYSCLHKLLNDISNFEYFNLRCVIKA